MITKTIGARPIRIRITGTAKIASRITTRTIAWNLMRILVFTTIMIRMITKNITRTTNALAKLSGSPPPVMVRSGMKFK